MKVQRATLLGDIKTVAIFCFSIAYNLKYEFIYSQYVVEAGTFVSPASGRLFHIQELINKYLCGLKG